jgi:hypothetical protein
MPGCQCLKCRGFTGIRPLLNSGEPGWPRLTFARVVGRWSPSLDGAQMCHLALMPAAHISLTSTQAYGEGCPEEIAFTPDENE